MKRPLDSLGPAQRRAVNSVCAGFLIGGLLCGSAIGWAVGSRYGDMQWQQAAVRRGVAEYDSKTGLWRWSGVER